MADVILKNASGQDVTYEGVDNVALINTDGAIETFVAERLIQNQIQADWNQTDETALDYIKNKPETFEAEDELPEVTTEDDGKLLGVLNGVWQKVDAPEGGSGGSSLPEVTTDDNGKVLGVVEGVWAKMTVPSGENSSGSIGQVQVDWNENDETSVVYIKNRPFYEGNPTMQEVLPTMALTFTMNQGMYEFVMTPPAEYLSLWASEWNFAKLVWGGVEYICEPQFFNGAKCIGNIDLMTGGDSGEPFIMMMADAATMGEDICMIYDLETPVTEETTEGATVSREISLSLELQEIKKLDPKFIENIDYETQIINKPFYTTLSGTILLNATIDCNIEVDGLYAALVDEIDIIDGAKYYVQIDGAGYPVTSGTSNEITLMEYQSDDMSFFVANNYSPNQTVIALPTQGEHTCIIATNGDAVKKIDVQYLPDDIGGLPESTTSDSGKVLTVGSDGTASWQTPASGLPEVSTTDDGKVLKVVSGAWTVTEEEEQEKELPTVTTDDNGKFLRVVDGIWAAQTIQNAEEVQF